MKKLILIRHGESQWNLENRFTGWCDVDLTEKGREQAAIAGRKIAQAGLLLPIDVAYTSLLKRAIRTLWIILDQVDQMWVDVHRHWRLNERHYGVLQGLNKTKTIEKYGAEQVHIWRRSYNTNPDPVSTSSDMHPINDIRYTNLEKKLLPATESLHQVRKRLLPLWDNNICSQLQQNKQILIVAHGNSLRALTMYLTGMSEQEVMDFNIPTGIPLILTMNEKNMATNMSFLDNPNS